LAVSFDIDYVVASIPALARGLGMTVLVSSLSRVPIAHQAIQGYVEFIRNTPLLVQIFFIFYGLPPLGLRLSPFWSGVLTLTLWGGAFNVENFRGGFLAIGKGLSEAASLGPARGDPLGTQHFGLGSEELRLSSGDRARRAHLRGDG